MSSATYYYGSQGDSLASSNNSINDNKLNAKRAKSTVHQLKQLIRPFLEMVKNGGRKKNTYRKNAQPEETSEISEIDQNSSNELLESRIFAEIDECDDFAAVPVYNDGHMDLLEVFRGQRYIPVHFAKTEAGTFFWTSMLGADCDISHHDKNSFTTHQVPQLQVACDRWAQA